MSRKRKAVELGSYDKDPYDDDESALMIDLKSTSDVNNSDVNNTEKDKEIQRLKMQLMRERQDHKKVLLSLRALIDTHIAKVDLALDDKITNGSETKSYVQNEIVHKPWSKAEEKSTTADDTQTMSDFDALIANQPRVQITKASLKEPCSPGLREAAASASPTSPVAVAWAGGQQHTVIEDLPGANTGPTIPESGPAAAAGGSDLSTPAKAMAINKIWKRKFDTPTPKKEKTSPSKKKEKTTPGSSQKKEKLYAKGEFLAVLNSYEGFFICKTLQNIFTSAKRIKIKWLTQNQDDGSSYHYDYEQNIGFSSILTNVLLEKGKGANMVLPQPEFDRVTSILQENNEQLDESKEGESERKKSKRKTKNTRKTDTAKTLAKTNFRVQSDDEKEEGVERITFTPDPQDSPEVEKVSSETPDPPVTPDTPPSKYQGKVSEPASPPSVWGRRPWADQEETRSRRSWGQEEVRGGRLPSAPLRRDPTSLSGWSYPSPSLPAPAPSLPSPPLAPPAAPYPWARGLQPPSPSWRGMPRASNLPEM